MILNYQAEPPTSLGYIHDVICWTVGVHRPAALPLTLHRGQADNSERPSRPSRSDLCHQQLPADSEDLGAQQGSQCVGGRSVGRSMGELLVQADRCFLGHLDDRYGRRQGRGRSVLATAAADFSNRLRTICLTHTGRSSRIGRTDGRKEEGRRRATCDGDVKVHRQMAGGVWFKLLTDSAHLSYRTQPAAIGLTYQARDLNPLVEGCLVYLPVCPSAYPLA